jgi:hypothetical protein
LLTAKRAALRRPFSCAPVFHVIVVSIAKAGLAPQGQGSTVAAPGVPRGRGSEGKDYRVKRNGLYLIIVVLAVAAGVLGYKVYQDQQEPSGLNIQVGKDGISVETN